MYGFVASNVSHWACLGHDQLRTASAWVWILNYLLTADFSLFLDLCGLIPSVNALINGGVFESLHTEHQVLHQRNSMHDSRSNRLLPAGRRYFEQDRFLEENRMFSNVACMMSNPDVFVRLDYCCLSNSGRWTQGVRSKHIVGLFLYNISCFIIPLSIFLWNKSDFIWRKALFVVRLVTDIIFVCCGEFSKSLPIFRTDWQILNHENQAGKSFRSLLSSDS